MQRAIELAANAEAEGEVPVGAVVVHDGVVISEGWNRLVGQHDATAHAEMIALRQAGKILQNYRLHDTVLYVTLEPCPMCAYAMVHSRVSKVIFGASDTKRGVEGSIINLLRYDSVNHHVTYQSGVMKEACGEQLRAFFRRRRIEKKVIRENRVTCK